MENLKDTQSRYSQYVMPTYAPKMLFTRGQGSRLWDADGNEYLDFATGIAVCNRKGKLDVISVYLLLDLNLVGVVYDRFSDVDQ